MQSWSKHLHSHLQSMTIWWYTGRLSSLETATVNAVAGSVAGGLAAGITTPFDVIKTQLQTTKNLGQSQTMLTSATRWAGPSQWGFGQMSCRVMWK